MSKARCTWSNQVHQHPAKLREAWRKFSDSISLLILSTGWKVLRKGAAWKWLNYMLSLYGHQPWFWWTCASQGTGLPGPPAELTASETSHPTVASSSWTTASPTEESAWRRRRGRNIGAPTRRVPSRGPCTTCWPQQCRAQSEGMIMVFAAGVNLTWLIDPACDRKSLWAKYEKLDGHSVGLSQ